MIQVSKQGDDTKTHKHTKPTTTTLLFTKVDLISITDHVNKWYQLPTIVVMALMLMLICSYLVHPDTNTKKSFLQL